MFLKVNIPLLIGISASVLIICLFFIILILIKAKSSKIKVDEEFIENLIQNYGGKENIKEVNVDNARLKVLVLDLEAVNLDALKEVSQAGVFVTGNHIKTLFKYDSLLIKNSLEKKL